MKYKRFKELELKYIELFKERPWILRYMNIPIEEQIKLLEESIKDNKRIEIDK